MSRAGLEPQPRTTLHPVERMPKGPWRMVDQAIGSSLSILGNIGEANGRERKRGEVEQHYRYAQGSAFEAATHLDALAALNVIDDEEYNAAEQRLARIAAMLTALMKRQRRKAGAERRRKRAGSQPRQESGSAPVAQPARPEGIELDRSEAP